MIKKSVFENDLIVGMQQELRKQASGETPDLVKAGECLHAALEILEEAGLQVRAEQVLQVLTKIAIKHHKKDKVKDPGKPHNFHMKNLTPERMVENLKHHGTVFNMADDQGADNADFDPEVAEALDAMSVDDLRADELFDMDIADVDDNLNINMDTLEDFEDEVSSPK
jgi:hypothetical protein